MLVQRCGLDAGIFRTGLRRVIGLVLAGSRGLVGSGSLECLGREVRRWRLHGTSQGVQCGGIGFCRKGGTNVPISLLAGWLA
jgi:hypothetical protein